MKHRAVSLIQINPSRRCFRSRISFDSVIQFFFQEICPYILIKPPFFFMSESFYYDQGVSMNMKHLCPDKRIFLTINCVVRHYQVHLMLGYQGSTSCVPFQGTYSDRDISGLPSTWKGFCLAREHCNLLTFLVINQTHGIYWCPEIRTQIHPLKISLRCLEITLKIIFFLNIAHITQSYIEFRWF